MPDGLYDGDILAWSEHQAELLRRLAAGERLNESVDWANVIEEVESVGRSELRACESLLLQALIHLLKMHLWREGEPMGHWQEETRGFLNRARRQFSPSMRQRIDMADLYRDAVYEVTGTSDDFGPQLPDACPFTLDDLLAPRTDIAALAGKLSPQAKLR